jgi:hypothetical protein
MIDLNDKDLSILDHDSVIIEQFGEKHFISTRSATSADHELIYDAICIATAVYMKKLKDGEVHINRVYH